MKVLVDTNVLMDVLAQREPFAAASSAVWALAEAKKVEAVVSAVSLTTVFYLGGRFWNHDRAMEAIRKIVSIFEVAPADDATVRDALGSSLYDFEDALQAFAGVRVGATHVVTRDPDGFAGGPLVVLSPEQFLGAVALTP